MGTDILNLRWCCSEGCISHGGARQGPANKLCLFNIMMNRYQCLVSLSCSYHLSIHGPHIIFLSFPVFRHMTCSKRALPKATEKRPLPISSHPEQPGLLHLLPWRVKEHICPLYCCGTLANTACVQRPTCQCACFAIKLLASCQLPSSSAGAKDPKLRMASSWSPKMGSNG